MGSSIDFNDLLHKRFDDVEKEMMSLFLLENFDKRFRVDPQYLCC